MRKMLIFLVLIGLIVVGCAPQIEQPEAEQPEAEQPEETVVEKIQIEFWNSLSGDYGEYISNLVDEYNESQDAVEVTYVFKGNYQDTQMALLADLAANNPPDVSMMEVSFAATMAGKGALTPIQNFIDDPEVGLSQEEYDSILDGLKEAVSLNGVMYTMPFNLSHPALYFNQDLLDANNIDVPETWNEFASACQNITSGDTFGFTLNPGNLWVWEAKVMQNGGRMFNEDYTEVLFNKPAAVESLEFIADLVASGCAKAQAWEEGRTEFFNGNVAFIEESSGSLSGILETSDFNVGVTHLPWGRERVVTIGGATLGILGDIPEENQTAAWDFIKFITTPEVAADWSAFTGYIPISSLALETEPLKSLLETDPLRMNLMESLPYLTPRPRVEGYAEIERNLRGAIESVGLQRQSAQEALDQAAVEANRILGLD